MGEPLLDLSSNDSWQLVYNETKTASYLNSTDYRPIPSFELPFILHSPYLLIEAANIEAKPWWFLGCRILQIVQVGVAPSTALADFRRIPVNRPTLCKFPRLADDYLLKVEIPPWYDRMKIAIHEYAGDIGDTTEELIIERSDVIRVDLTRIETKIDQLL
jgi:hypothetical protein